MVGGLVLSTLITQKHTHTYTRTSGPKLHVRALVQSVDVLSERIKSITSGAERAVGGLDKVFEFKKCT